jgi:hypothetical protein
LNSKWRRDYPPMPLILHGVEWLLTNKFYVGIVEWNGVEYPAVMSRWWTQRRSTACKTSSRPN